MIFENVKCKFIGCGMGGQGAGSTFSASFEFEIEPGDFGLRGFGDYVFGCVPLFRDALIEDDSPNARLSVDAAQAFNGTKNHIFRAWGIEADHRTSGIGAHIDVDTATVRGKAAFEIVRPTDDKDERGDRGLMRLNVKIPADSLGRVSIKELGALLHTSMWLDMAPAQTETDDVVPTVREAEDDPEDPQPTLELPAVEVTEPHPAEPLFDVVLFALGLNPDVKAVIEAIRDATGLSAKDARGAFNDVKEGERVPLGLWPEAKAKAIAERIEQAGAAVRIEPSVGAK